MSYVQCFEYHCHTYVQLEVPVVISLSFHLFLEIGGPSRDFPLFSSIYGDWRFRRDFPLFCSDIGDWKFQHGFPSPLLCHLGFSTALSDTSRITKLTLQECD